MSMAVIEGQGDNDDAEISLPYDDFSDSVPLGGGMKQQHIYNKLEENLGAPEKVLSEEEKKPQMGAKITPLNLFV